MKRLERFEPLELLERLERLERERFGDSYGTGGFLPARVLKSQYQR